MIVARGERYPIKLIRRIENSYEYDEKNPIEFKGRPASQKERKNYRIMQGVEGTNSTNYIISSNLPTCLKERDKIVYLGKEWQVESIGYFFDESRFVNPGIMSEEYIMSKCPKGIAIS